MRPGDPRRGKSHSRALNALFVGHELSPDLCSRLRAAGHEAAHWSSVGAHNARDEIIMGYAREHDQVVITHDFDFGSVLAITHADGPSVVQVRTEDVLSDRFISPITAAVKQFDSELRGGAIVIIDEDRSRVRVLPIG